MAWFNADDKMHSHPKIRAAGLEAIGLWTVAGTYSTDYLTDGHVPQWFVDSWPRGKTLAGKLIKADLWVSTEEGYQFRSWTEYQQTRDEVLEKKEAHAERMRAWRAQQRENKKKSVSTPPDT